MDLAGLQEAVFSVDELHFDALALEVFRFQSQNCQVYNRYLEHLQTDITNIQDIADIPYLPIEFFKNFEVKTGEFEPELVFESSSTTGKGVSRHFVKNSSFYTESCTKSFKAFFGDHHKYCHLALLPSYLERGHSSLVFQVNHFIAGSDFPQSSFFLHDMDRLHQVLSENEHQQIPTMLWGVTYALLDFIEKYPMQLQHTTVLETGGMKGKRKEITREELHGNLKKALGITNVSGEYGMTELMSQAYAIKDGIYRCPPWMRVAGREINDPLGKPVFGRHVALNVTDLANLHSCSFVSTSDIGKVNMDRSFTVLGRMDYSDTRGCNLLV
jgi:hypothetical protein